MKKPAKPTIKSEDFKPSPADVATAPERMKKIITALKKLYPDAHTALDFTTPLELLIATILSAQCTDVRVNIVTKDLFKKYRSARAYARANPAELEQDIKTTGFYKNKAKSILACTKILEEQFGGAVPRTLEELVKLPGVGRKTANVVLGNAYGIPGIVTDTHVIRLSRLTGISLNSDPVKLEFDLMELVPKKDWTLLGHLLICHGRAICIARRPKCDPCAIRPWCGYGQLTLKQF